MSDVKLLFRFTLVLAVLLLATIVLVGLAFFNANHAATQAHKAAVAVQSNRRDTILRQCIDTNQRNHAAIAYLTGLSRQQIKAGANPKSEAAGLREFTALVNAFEPVKADCEAYASQQAPLAPVQRK